MKARALGRFVAEFLEGFAGGEETPEVAAPVTPIVVQEDMVRRAVAEFLAPMVDAAADETPPSGQQLDMMFDDARQDPADIADLAVRRAQQMQAEAEERDQAARNNGAVPQTYDPNDPGGKPWMSAAVERSAS